MKKTTKYILSFALLAFVFSVPLFVGASDASNLAAAQAATGNGGFSANQGQDNSGLATTSVYKIITTVLNWLLMIVTVLAVIGFVISGIMFVTAGGSDRGEDAQKWLTYSIMGIIVALIGYIVVNVVSSLLGGTVQGG